MPHTLFNGLSLLVEFIPPQNVMHSFTSFKANISKLTKTELYLCGKVSAVLTFKLGGHFEEIPSKNGVVTNPHLSVYKVKLRASREWDDVNVISIFCGKGADEVMPNSKQFTDEYKSGGF